MQTLNIDVLVLVLDQLPPKETLPFATVCKVIHNIIIRDILSSVTPDTHYQLCGFMQFVLAAPSERIPLLRKLTINADVLSPGYWSKGVSGVMGSNEEEDLVPLRNLASFLTQILNQSDTLQSLSLSGCKYFFRMHPELRAAFIEYTHLKELLLFNVDKRVGFEVIKDMKSRLRTISIELCRLDEEEIHLSYIPCLAAHLELQDISFASRHRNDFVLDDETLVHWPSVTSLSITNSGVLLAPLVKAFPNLRSLSYWGYSVADVPQTFPQYQWPVLDYLNTSPDMMRTSSLRSTVRWLDLGGLFYDNVNVSDGSDGPSNNDVRIINVLDATHPAILTLRCSHNIKPIFWTKIANTAPQVKVLYLTVYHEGLKTLYEKWMVRVLQMYGDEHLMKTLFILQKTVPRSMSLLTAPCLCITFRESNSILQEPQVEETRVAQAIVDENVPNVLAHSLPHLYFLAITAGPYFTYKNEVFKELPERRTWWRIRRPEGGVPVAEPISHWAGERVLERLQSMSYDALMKLKSDEISAD